jgi:RNA polymerase sigma-70 factor (sigma-E family)
VDQRGLETTSFEDFVSREQGALLRLAVLLAGDRGHAEDLVQTALLATYRHWDRVSGRGDPTAYVRRAVVTAHTSWRRRLSSTEQVVETVPDRPGPADVADGDEELRAALRTLPPRMRAAVVLRYYADLSEQQAAEAMGCSASAVNTHTTRGLARLRALLSAPVPVPGEGS